MHAWSSDGIYSIRVKLKDEFGLESGWLNPFLVKIDGTPPTLEVMKPKQGFLYILDKQVSPCFATIMFGKITVEVNSVDNTSGISHVQFFIDDVLKATITTSPYSWMWTEKSFFRYILQVTAYDLAGNNASKQILVWKFF